MKQILLTCLLLAGMAAGAQNKQAQNFIVENGDIYWRKTYPTSISFKEIAANVKTEAILDKPDVEDPLITGQLIPFNGDYKGAGYSSMKASLFILSAYVNGGATIRYADGQCVVTVKRIVLTDMMDAGILAQRGVKTELREIMLKKDGSMRSSLNNISDILDYSFNKMFASLF